MTRATSLDNNFEWCADCNQVQSSIILNLYILHEKQLIYYDLDLQKY
jgi:hypothetical protein